MADMKNICACCDKEGKDEVPIDELRTIMKSLDVNVKEDLKRNAV